MADHSDNGLRAAIKALNDVVAPALDADNPVAQEQLRLVVQFLEFHRERLPHHVDRDRFELLRHVSLAQRLAEHTEPWLPSETDELRAALAEAEEVGGLGWVRPQDARRATGSLETAISTVVRAAAGLDEDPRRQIERTVVEAAAGLLDGQRAWFAPQGFEPDPAAVPALADAFGIPTGDAHR